MLRLGVEPYWHLSSNEMLLGKTGGGGVVIAEKREKLRVSSVENVLSGFWKIWQMLYMYSMATLKKWNKKHRNVQKGDVVLVEDSNALRCQWTIGIVKEFSSGRNGLVRAVSLCRDHQSKWSESMNFA